MLYFAYGSNMDPEQMALRCPGSRLVGTARLPGYRLAFSRYSSKRNGGVADVVPDPDHEVWGVVWDLSEENLAILDGFEGYDPGGTCAYSRTRIEVESEQGTLEAEIYFATRQPNPPPPSRAYMQHLIEGAKAHGLPDDYLRMLESIECR